MKTSTLQPKWRLFSVSLSAPAELAEQLGEIDYLSRTELLTKPPLNSLSIEQARAIMDLAPQFNAKSQPTVDETTGVRQCVMLVKHYEAEKAAKG